MMQLIYEGIFVLPNFRPIKNFTLIYLKIKLKYSQI